MSDIAIQNNMGRDYSIAVLDGLLVKNVVLKKGLNLLKGDVWDSIKNHPAVKALTEVLQDKIVERIAQNEGNSKMYFTRTATIGKKKLEVTDYRKSSKKD